MTDTDNHDWLGLSGRTCVVTGASSGIGRATAIRLARAGGRMALMDIDASGLNAVAATITDAGGTAVALPTDTSDEAAVNAAAARAAAEIGPAQVLVNNAGLLRPGQLEDLSLEAWNKVLSVNLSGYFLCARAFGNQMIQNGGGAMAHVASIAGSNPQTRSGAYTPAKFGVVGLARQIAAEWGPKGIRSNAVSPGMIRTALSEAFYQQPGVEERRAAVVPSRRVGQPDDIAKVIVFLVSDLADYVNGIDILVDGGFGSALMDLVPRPGFDS